MTIVTMEKMLMIVILMLRIRTTNITTCEFNASVLAGHWRRVVLLSTESARLDGPVTL